MGILWVRKDVMLLIEYRDKAVLSVTKNVMLLRETFRYYSFFRPRTFRIRTTQHTILYC
jgi:hypothetical protein